LSSATTDPFFSDAYRDDPAGVIARMRREDPVHYLAPIDAWFVSRYDLIHRLYTDPAVTNDPRAYAHYRPPPPDSPLAGAETVNLFSAPPEQHARMRALVAKALTPRAVARMEDQVVRVVEQYAAPLRGRRGRIDVLGEFFEPIPNTVVSRITGIPPKGDDEVRFRALGRASLSLIDPLLPDDERRVGLEASAELREWIRQMARERRERPRDDLISDLAQAADFDDRLSVEEIASVVSALIAAGTDTTVAGGLFALRSLLQHPEAFEELRVDRKLLPAAVNELLRFDFGPLDWLPRYAVRDFELEGRPVKQGQLLMLSFMGADRDPAVFPDPDRLDLHRDTSRLAIFGHGPHFCLGANLARQELRCMLDAALDFLPPGSRWLADEVEWAEGPGPLFRRILRAPVEIAC
jgi:unspecific monooxygenase